MVYMEWIKIGDLCLSICCNGVDLVIYIQKKNKDINSLIVQFKTIACF